MLWDSRSVLARTAEALSLYYYPGEPLRIDAVFSAKKRQWFPMSVAIEHENQPSGLASEIRKLLSVRVPLKVCTDECRGTKPVNNENAAWEVLMRSYAAGEITGRQMMRRARPFFKSL